MNGTRKLDNISADPVPQETGTHKRARKDAHEERREREAWALVVVKAMARSPNSPPEEFPPEPTHLPGNDPDAPGVVYFAYSTGRIKIGYSIDADRRMIGYGTHSPMPVTLLMTIRGSEEDEDSYHEMFAEDRVNREWFRLSFRLREFLESKFSDETLMLMSNAEFDAYDDMTEACAYVRDLNRDIQEELDGGRAD